MRSFLVMLTACVVGLGLILYGVQVERSKLYVISIHRYTNVPYHHVEVEDNYKFFHSEQDAIREAQRLNADSGIHTKYVVGKRIVN